MSVLLESCKHLYRGYEVVILMSLKESSLSESMLYLMENNEPLFKNLVVGLAKFGKHAITDLVLLAHGIELIFNDI